MKFRLIKCSEKGKVLCDSTAKEVLFDWSHHSVSSTDSVGRTTLLDSITHYRSQRFKEKNPFDGAGLNNSFYFTHTL